MSNPTLSGLMAAAAVSLPPGSGVVIAQPTSTPGKFTFGAVLPGALGGNLAATTTTSSSPGSLGTLSGNSAAGTLRVIGQVIARNTATGDSSIWDVAVAAKIAGGLHALFGLPAISVFAQDASMSACAVSASAGPSGITFNVIGLAGATIAWSSFFSQPVEA